MSQIQKSTSQFVELNYEDMWRQSVKDYPYEVWHEEGEGITPKFKTWREALDAQKKWNVDCPGHKARKRTVP